MRVTRASERRGAVSRLDGAMQEEQLIASSSKENPGAWELVWASLRKGANALPVPFPTEEIGLVLAGRVELIELAFDYDIGEPLESQGRTLVLGPGDAFHFLPGDRIWMEVLDDLTMVYTRRICTVSGGSGC